ncbi:MAG: hypothetical protein RL204_50 [Bacteroidota bacterium]
MFEINRANSIQTPFTDSYYYSKERKQSMSEDNFEPLLTRKCAAKYLGVSPDTLAVWDCTKRYDLKPIKVGRAVRYRKADLDKFIFGDNHA